MAKRSYIPITLSKAAAQGQISTIPLLPSAQAFVPELSFGKMGPPSDLTASDSILGRINDPVSAASYIREAVNAFVIEDATIYAEAGLITTGDHLITNFLYLFDRERLPGWSGDCGPTDDGRFVFPTSDPQSELEYALHALAGSCRDNYYHWMIDVVSRMGLYRELDLDLNSYALLIPVLNTRYKVESLPMFGWDLPTKRQCADETCIHVKKLIVTPDVSGFGFSYHPGIAKSFKRRLGVDEDTQPLTRRIYISRRDSPHRPLVNEDEVIETVVRAGFEVIVLSNYTLAEQAGIFAAASHIIAPHGAGLTNLLFCGPGGTLLELHMNSYVQWFFRRLAGVAGMRYGCLIGEAIGASDSVHLQKWRLDIPSLKNILSSKSFTECRDLGSTQAPV
jgi:Glycosyltransferase 61